MGTISNMGSMGIPESYGAGMYGPAPWLFGNPGMYQGNQGYQGYGGFQGQGRAPGQQWQQAGSQSQGMSGATPGNTAGMNPQMAGMYPQGYAGSSQFWQGMPNPYQPGVAQRRQPANWPPAAAGMYPQGFGGSAPYWRRQAHQGQQAVGPHAGHGPQGYQRSDERIKEDVHDRLTAHGRLDARGISVAVNNGEVTLGGTVESRQAKHTAEDVAESVLGVKNVENQLKVQPRQGQPGQQFQQPGQQPLQGWERFEGMSAPHGLHPSQQAEQRAWQAGSLH